MNLNTSQQYDYENCLSYILKVVPLATHAAFCLLFSRYKSNSYYWHSNAKAKTITVLQ
jgi:hypothetical protein